MNTSTATETSGPTNKPPGRRLAAVMFADIANYSHHMEINETFSSLQAAKSVELFRSLVGDYGGEVANVAGDGVLALFRSAEQAIRFAIQVQGEFRDQAVWDDGEPVQVRIGINLGEVLELHGIVQGHCVNVAARLQQIADPGRIVVSAAIRDAVREQSSICLQPLGRKVLKNIAEPIEVFSVTEAAAPTGPVVARVASLPSTGWRQPLIAVLAFQNLSADAANDHLCEGVAEDIIANLTRFRNLAVIARHSSFQFSVSSYPVREIGHRLGVQYLLTGNLRRIGKRVRIGTQLIQVDTEAAIWSDQFKINIEELFDLQDEISGAVASRLAVQIDIAQRKEPINLKDMRAYGLLLRGQLLVANYAKESNAHGRRLFEEARELAPEYGRIYSALSRTHNLDWRYSWSEIPEKSLSRAVELARIAVLHDPLDARGFAELGFANLYMKRLDESLADYVRALSLNPNDADIIAEYADALVYCGQANKSIELLERAIRLNPYYPDWYLWYLADAYFTLARYSEVILTVKKMQNPDEGRRMLAASYAHLGDVEEARKQATEVLRVHPEFRIALWRERPPYRDQLVLDAFVEGMRMAGLPE
jgi:TolB-like protein/class 3 adenylate cyclase/Flp pilus assembly protein TadD